MAEQDRISLNNANTLKHTTGHLTQWETNAEGIEQARLHGLLHTESLIGKVNSLLGRYRQIELQRYYRQDGHLGDKHSEKSLVLDYAQESLDALTALERCINDDSEQRKESINQAIQTAKKKLDELKRRLEEENRLAHRINNFTDEQKSLLDTIQQKNNSGLLNHNQGIDPLFNEIKYATLEIVENTKTLNQYLTYQYGSYAFFRGAFHDCCEKALAEARFYQPDLNNRILLEHQGFYNLAEAETITVPLSHLNSREAIENAVMSIVNIAQENKEITIKLSSLSYRKKAANAAMLFYNLIISIIIGIPVDLFLLFIPNLLFYFSQNSFFQVNAANSLKFQDKNFYKIDDQTLFQTTMAQINIANESLGITAIRHIHFIMNATIFDMVHGLYTSLLQFFILFIDIKLFIVDNYLSNTRKTNQEVIEEAFKINVDKKTDPGTANITTKKAIPPYHLSSFSAEPKDLLSTASSVVGGLIGGITSLYEEDSFLALAIMCSCAIAALAIAAPHIVSPIIAPDYTKIITGIGNSLGGSDPVASTISATMMQGQFTSLLGSLAAKLSNSNIPSCGDHFNHPNEILLFITAFLLVGYGAPIDFRFDKFFTDPAASFGHAPAMGQAAGTTNSANIVAKMGQLSQGTKAAGIMTSLSYAPQSGNSKSKAESVKAEQNTGLDALLDDFRKNPKNYHQILQQCEQKAGLLLNLLEVRKKGQQTKSYQERRRLFNAIYDEYKEDDEVRNLAYGILIRYQETGIFSSTLVLFFKYVPLLIRALLHFRNQSSSACYELRYELNYDATRILSAFATLADKLSNLIKAVIAAVGDVLVNNVGARIEGIVRHEQANQKEIAATAGLSYLGDLSNQAAKATDRAQTSLGSAADSLFHTNAARQAATKHCKIPLATITCAM